jgi:hypothetical protein
VKQKRRTRHAVVGAGGTVLLGLDRAIQRFCSCVAQQHGHSRGSFASFATGLSKNGCKFRTFGMQAPNAVLHYETGALVDMQGRP